jgi:hypothetical protein
MSKKEMTEEEVAELKKAVEKLKRVLPIHGLGGLLEGLDEKDPEAVGRLIFRIYTAGINGAFGQL